MGLLDSFSPEVQSLFAAPAEDTEAAIRRRQLLTMGLAMMQNQQMKPLQAIGYGGQVALASGDQQRQQLDAQRQRQMQSYAQALALQNGIDQRQQTIGARGVVNDFYNGQPQGPAPVVGMGPPAPDGSMSQQPAPQGPPNLPGMPMSKRDLAAQYQALGSALQQKGYVEQAKAYFDQAEKMAPKLKDTKTLTRDGKRVTVNFYDDGTHEILPDVGPDAEKAHFLDTGGKIVAADAFTGNPVPGGAIFEKTQTPDSAASNAVTIRGQNMTDARARDALAAQDNSPMSDAAITNAAARYNIDGTLPPLGMGRNARTDRKNILDQAATLASQSGLSPDEQRIQQIGNKANTAALTKLNSQASMVGAFEKTFNKNADLALEYSAKVDRTGVPIVNKWLLAGKRSVMGDPDTAAFDVAVKSAVNEYTKIISGSMGNTPMAEGEIKKVEGMLAVAQTPEQVKSVIGFMRRETQNRMTGFADQQRELRAGMRSGAKPAGSTNIDDLVKKYTQ